MFKNFAMDEKCQLYISLKDIVYSKDLTDLYVLVSLLLYGEREDKLYAYNLLKKIEGFEECLQSVPASGNVLESSREIIFNFLMGTGKAEYIYINDSLPHDCIYDYLKIDTKMIFLLMSKYFLSKEAFESPSVHLLYDDIDVKYMPLLVEKWKNKAIHIDEFINNLSSVKSHLIDGTVDIMVGNNFINKYHDKLQGASKFKIIMPHADASIMHVKHKYIPTVIYDNAIV